MRRRAAALAAALVVVAGAGTAEAQIVNVQGLVGVDAPEGWSGGLDAAVDWRTGNVDLLVVGAAATARWRRGDHLVFAIVKGDYGRVGEEGKTFLKRTFEHLRYRWRATPLLTAEAFVQNEADRFRRLSVRALAGAGPRLNLVREGTWRVAVGLAYMAEFELIRDDPGLPDAGDEQLNHRASSYVVLSASVNPYVTVTETFYAQPRLDEPTDLRLLSELGLTSKLTPRISWRTAFVVAYDRTPPATIERLDTTLQAGVSLTF